MAERAISPHCNSVPSEGEREVLSAVLKKLWQGHWGVLKSKSAVIGACASQE